MPRNVSIATMAVTALALLLLGCGEEPAVEAPASVTEPAHNDHGHEHGHDHGHEHDHSGEHQHGQAQDHEHRQDEHDHDDHGHDHDHHHHDHAHGNGEVPAAPDTGDPYTLATCPVSGMELGSMGAPIVHEHNGRQVRFCCDECIEPFEDEPDKHLAAIDEQLVEQQLEHYPLETCVISGAELGSMGDPVNHVYGNRLVRFCCAGCDDDFEAEPATHLATIDAAVIEREKSDYPIDKCVVSAEPLDEWGEPVDRVFANRLVRFCCDTCAEDFHADPAKYLALREAGEVPDEPAQHDHDHDHSHDHDHGDDDGDDGDDDGHSHDHDEHEGGHGDGY